MKRAVASIVLPVLFIASPARAVPAVHDVIVRLDGAASTDVVERLARAAGGFRIGARWHIINAFAASMTDEQRALLTSLPHVVRVEPDLIVHATASNARSSFGVTKAVTDFGVTGDRDGAARTWTRTDVVACVVDTGIDTTHVDLDGGQVIAWRDFVNARTTPYDDNGHGTHVSSILAGQGDGSASYKGVAPGTALIGAKVLDSSGSGASSRIISGVQFCVDQHVRVINLSLGSSVSSDGTDALSAAVNSAASAGTVPVVAAGNSGPAERTIGTPAAAASALTVCSMADTGVNGFFVSTFSSRGPTADGRVKPDICGPGESIRAAKANSGNGYVTLSGTSMATPFVAGVVALMLDANPAMTPSSVKSAVMQTAQDWRTAGADSDTGAGRLQAYEAIKKAGSYTGTGPSVPGHWMQSQSLATSSEDRWKLVVTSATAPIALTLIIPSASASKDFDLYLAYDSGSGLIYEGSSETAARQETVGFNPSATGTYYAIVRSYAGSGSYYLDLSYKGNAPALGSNG
ncbi:MAG: S8 family serine peptidase [Actinomycetota bacterium]